MIDSNTTVETGTDVKRNREQWLTDFIALSLPLVRERTSLSIGDRKIQISCGFPSSGARKSRRTGRFTSGQCHHTHGTERKRFQIFIHPGRDNAMDIGETCLHETLHALLEGGVGHRAPFSRAAKKLGLMPKEDESFTGIAGKATSTQLSKELAVKVQEIVDQLGEYPHEGVWASGGKQSTRLLKAICSQCGHTIRTTQKWLDEVGYPICPCNGEQMGPDTGEVEPDPLVAVARTFEYKVKNVARKSPKDPVHDPRWAIFMKDFGNGCEWLVLDYKPVPDVPALIPLPDGVEGPQLPMRYEDGPHKGEIIYMAPLGVVPTRLTPAESREDAIDLMEALRDGRITYKDLEDNDADVDDIDGDHDYESDDEPETFDFEDDDSDPRFQWEIDRGIDIAAINPDNEADKREAWASERS